MQVILRHRSIPDRAGALYTLKAQTLHVCRTKTMKLLANIMLFATLAACSRVAPAPSAASCNVASCVRQVDAWGANSLRVRVVMPGHQVTQPAAQGLLPEPPAGSPDATVSGDGRTITNGNMRVVIGSDGTATFTRVSDGALLFSEAALSLLEPSPLNATLAPTSSGSISFGSAAHGEVFYGFGEHRGGKRCTNQCTNASLPLREWSWRISDSQDVGVLPNNGNAWVPYFSSSRGYGVLWNSAGYGKVSIANAPFALDIAFDAVRVVDYWVTTTAAKTSTKGDVPPYRDLLRQYAAATGPPPPLPHEYTGFWQCKLRYSSQEQILRIANGYKERGLPISVIVIDYHHWVHEGDWRFSDDPEVPGHTTGCWPKPGDMVQNLTAMGIKCAVSVWPDVDTKSINFANMSAQQLLIRGRDGKQKVSVQGKYYVDAFNGRTRAYLFDQLVRGYAKYGIDTFWMDATEPQGANIGEWSYALDDGQLHADAAVFVHLHPHQLHPAAFWLAMPLPFYH